MKNGNINVSLLGRRIAWVGSAATVAIVVFFSGDPCRFCPRISSICEVRGFRARQRLGRHGAMALIAVCLVWIVVSFTAGMASIRSRRRVR